MSKYLDIPPHPAPGAPEETVGERSEAENSALKAMS